MPARPTVALVTLGCARNEVDSEELAGRLAEGGFDLTTDAGSADIAVVNTCGFVDAAKKDSIDTLLAAADLKQSGRTQAVVAVGCLAERYGQQLAESLPEADAVLGFDSYADIADRLRSVLAGERPVSHTPSDRRLLLPLSPVERHRPAGAASAATDGGGATAGQVPAQGSEDSVVLGSLDLPPQVAPAAGPRPVRRRLDGGPVAPLKLASGCDRRCTFCAIPAFRGAYLSRRPTEILGEARWLAEQGVKEIFLVSENSTSYGKDLGDLRLLETLLPELAAVEGIERVRLSYLQPAELRPGLIDVLTSTPKVVPYFDLSFQHSSGPVLRRMRRFGDTERFLELLSAIRERAPHAGARSNVIVGFPGETEADVAELERFLTEARLDAIGVFGYSDEEGTEAEGFDGKVDDDEIAARVARLTDLADELVAQRAEERLGETVSVLVERIDTETGEVEGRAEHQGPEVDGTTLLEGADGPVVGDLVTAVVTGNEGADLVAAVKAGA